MALNDTQRQQTAAHWAQQEFALANITANFSHADLKAAVDAVDNALDATLNQAVAAVGGTLTITQGLNTIIPAPFSTATAQQKSMLCCYVIMKRAGII